MVPYVGPIFAIVGMGLLIIAFYQLASILNNKEIFNKYLMSIIIGMGSVMFIFIVALMIVILTGFSKEQFITLSKKGVVWVWGIELGVSFICWILEIIAASFCAKSYRLVGDYFQIDLFNTAGTLLFWGAVTLITCIGGILYLLSYIFLAVAFFSLPDTFGLEPEKS